MRGGSLVSYFLRRPEKLPSALRCLNPILTDFRYVTHVKYIHEAYKLFMNKMYQSLKTMTSKVSLKSHII